MKDNLFDEANKVSDEEAKKYITLTDNSFSVFPTPRKPIIEWCGQYIEKYIPKLGSENASGYDLKADVKFSTPIPSHDWKVIPTGIKIQLPFGFDSQVRSRSGLAFKNGVFVLNSPGTIDNDYTGEIQVILMNLGPRPFVVNPGDRIAQLVLSQIIYADFSFGKLDKTERGEGGFGSTGIK